MHFQAIAPKAAKQSAKALRRYLQLQGIELDQGHALEAIARMSGFENWNALAAHFSPQGLAQLLHDFELAHVAAEEAEHTDYGKEAMLVAHTGFQLRYEDQAEACDYVRVCDPLGRELMYWSSDEWAQDPQEVMGAILGALVRGKPVVPEARNKKALPAAQPQTVPTVRAIPFAKVTDVAINGLPSKVSWTYEDVLKLLQLDAIPENSEFFNYDADALVALDIARDENGMTETGTVTYEQLKALAWDAGQRCFVNPQGQTWRFFIECEFGVDALPDSARSYVPPTPAQPSSPVASSEAKLADLESLVETPRLYEVALYAHQGSQPHAFLGKRVVAAQSEQAAQELVHNELWDPRLDAAACTPEAFVSPLGDQETGPFTLHLPDDSDDSAGAFEYFGNAWTAGLLKMREAGASHFRILNNNGDTVFDKHR